MTIMQVRLDGEDFELDTELLKSELQADNCVLVTVSMAGELVIDDMSHGEDYPYKREVWQMRPPGSGADNTDWADHQWEFCRSIKMEGSRGVFRP